MQTGLDTSHLAAAELLETVRRLPDDRAAGVPDGQGRGAARLREILDAAGCDYQRPLWCAVSRCGSEEAVAYLEWLVELMRARATIFITIRDAGAAMPLLPQGKTRTVLATFSGRCLIPQCGGTVDHHAWREELWARFYTAAPRRLRQSVERYSGVKRA